MADLTDFIPVRSGIFERRLRWKDKVVIDSKGQVRFNQQVLEELGELPFPKAFITIGTNEQDTLTFEFHSEADIKTSKFKSRGQRPYTYTPQSKKCQARNALLMTKVEPVVNMIIYRDSNSSKGKQYPDSIAFGNPVVNSDRKIVQISTAHMEKRKKNR